MPIKPPKTHKYVTTMCQICKYNIWVIYECFHYFFGQSYKASTIVIYDSRVMPDLKIPHFTTLVSFIMSENCLYDWPLYLTSIKYCEREYIFHILFLPSV